VLHDAWIIYVHVVCPYMLADLQNYSTRSGRAAWLFERLRIDVLTILFIKLMRVTERKFVCLVCPLPCSLSSWCCLPRLYLTCSTKTFTCSEKLLHRWKRLCRTIYVIKEPMRDWRRKPIKELRRRSPFVGTACWPITKRFEPVKLAVSRVSREPEKTGWLTT
jgi:hypothetical protein